MPGLVEIAAAPCRPRCRRPGLGPDHVSDLTITRCTPVRESRSAVGLPRLDSSKVSRFLPGFFGGKRRNVRASRPTHSASAGRAAMEMELPVDRSFLDGERALRSPTPSARPAQPVGRHPSEPRAEPGHRRRERWGPRRDGVPCPLRGRPRARLPARASRARPVPRGVLSDSPTDRPGAQSTPACSQKRASTRAESKCSAANRRAASQCSA
jgi:hypothetical protein